MRILAVATTSHAEKTCALATTEQGQQVAHAPRMVPASAQAATVVFTCLQKASASKTFANATMGQR